jgi:Fe-S cluster assembly protein SufB
MAVDTIEQVSTDYRYGFHDPENYTFKSGRGLTREVVEQISEMKDEPDWMRAFRLKSLEFFNRRPMPNWGADLSGIDFGNIFYYVKPAAGGAAHNWEDVPETIKNTYDKLGIPEAEKKFLAGVGAQYESETIYHKLREDLVAQGVIFLDTGEALRQHPELFKQYFGTVIPAER